MPVHAEDGNEDQHGMVEQMRQLAGDGEIAQQHQPGILAFDFAGMDAGLHQHDRQFSGARILRRENAISIGNHRDHGPALRRHPIGLEPDLTWRRFLQPLEIGQGVGVAGGGSEVRLLRGCGPVRRPGRHGKAESHNQDQKPITHDTHPTPPLPGGA